MLTGLVLGWLALFVLAIPWIVAHLSLPRWVGLARLDPSEDSSLSAALRIVVPARDEAANIGACVEALRSLPDGPWTAVVVDDGSEDATAEIARTAARGHPSITVIEAPERPEGWAGKPWACRCGADGDEPWVLFIDADVCLDPRAPAVLVATACRDDRDLLSVFGTWTLPSLGERWLVPAFGWVIRGSVDPRAVREGRAAFANGQCLLVRRTMYRAIGGHAAVAGDILDDVGLARAVGAQGGRVDIRYAPWAFRVRLYGSIAEILRGYHKNLHPGLGRGRAVSLLAAVALIASGLGPLGLAVVAWNLGIGGLTLAAGLLVVGQILLRWRIERLEGRDGVVGALGHPLAIAIVGGTLAASALWPRATWRRRSFAGGRAADR